MNVQDQGWSCHVNNCRKNLPLVPPLEVHFCPIQAAKPALSLILGTTDFSRSIWEATKTVTHTV